MANLITIGPDVESQPLNDNFAALNDDIVNVPHGIYRNAIINGNFDVWQRGTLFSSAGYTADRWWVSHGNGGGVATQESFTPGQTDVPGEPRYFLRISRNQPASSVNSVLSQRIEDVRTLAGQTVTLSFYARVGSGTKVILTRIQQVFGSGGSANENGPGKYHTITTSWQRFTHTFDVPSVSGKTIGNNSYLLVRFLEESGFSTFSIDFAQVQLNAGDVALPFQPRHFAEEMALCLRYFWRMKAEQPFAQFGAGTCTSTTKAIITIPFRTIMRVAPTVSWGGSFRLAVGAQSIPVTNMAVGGSAATTHTVGLDVTVADGLTPGYGVVLSSLDTSAYINFDAEL